MNFGSAGASPSPGATHALFFVGAGLLGQFIRVGIFYCGECVAFVEPTAKIDQAATLAAERLGWRSVRLELAFAGGATHGEEWASRAGGSRQ